MVCFENLVTPCINRYFTNFVGFNFDLDYIILETDVIKFSFLVNFKGHFLPPDPPPASGAPEQQIKNSREK